MKQLHITEAALTICVAFVLQLPTLTWFDVAVKTGTMIITAVVGVFAVLHYIDARKASKTRRELDELQIKQIKEKDNGKV